MKLLKWGDRGKIRSWEYNQEMVGLREITLSKVQFKMNKTEKDETD